MYDIDTITLDEYLDELVASLDSWYHLHLDEDGWFDDWLCIDDFVEHVESNGPIIGNMWFGSNIVEHGLRIWCEDNANLHVRCSECGVLCESGYENCDCEDPDWQDVDSDDLYEWMTDIYDLTNQGHAEYLANLFGEYILERAAREGVFNDWKEYFNLEAIGDDIEQALSEIEEYRYDDDKTELFATLTWANHICHVSGEIPRDYGGDELYEVICKIAEDGFEWLLMHDPEYAQEKRRQEAEARRQRKIERQTRQAVAMAVNPLGYQLALPVGG